MLDEEEKREHVLTLTPVAAWGIGRKHGWQGWCPKES